MLVVSKGSRPVNSFPAIPLPNDSELERRILSAMFNDADILAEIQEDYFYQESNKQIFRTIKMEVESGNTPNVFSISDKLPVCKTEIFEIEKNGLFDVIVIKKYISKLRELFEKRKTIESLIQSLYSLDANLPLDEVISRLMANIETLKTYPNRQKLLTEKASEWLQMEIDTPVPIISECLEAGTKVDIGGGSKLRKSWFTLQMAVCIASGRDFLGFKLGGMKRKVLLFNLEISKYHFQKRLSYQPDNDIEQAA